MLSAHDFTIWAGVGWVILLLALPVVFSVRSPGTLAGLSPSLSLHEFSEPLLLYVASLAGQLDFLHGGSGVPKIQSRSRRLPKLRLGAVTLY